MTLPVLNAAQFQEELAKIEAWLRNRYRAANTKVVTAGHILAPPFEVVCEVKDALMEVTISGANDSVTISCNRAVTSRFRSGQLGLFVVDDNDVVVGRRALATLAQAYQLILAAFPPGSVFDSDELYAKVVTKKGDDQKHARRRWKELKYDYGFEVDYSEQEGNFRYWRGDSELPIKDPNLRPNDKELRKAFVPILAPRSCKEHNDTLPHCARCDRRVYFEELGPIDEEFDEVGVLDHRRPVLQAGDDSEENLQIFCQTCNNLKGTICRKCPYTFRCDTCMWAFPETVRSRRVVLILEQGQIDILRQRYGNDVEAAVLATIKEMEKK